jgi:hypothetical protein
MAAGLADLSECALDNAGPVNGEDEARPDPADFDGGTDHAPTCPQCGSRGLPVIYGFPGPEMIEAAEAGRMVLGGCVVSGEDWSCTGPKRHVWADAEQSDAR